MSNVKLAGAINKLSKALNDFAKVFETHGSHITDDAQKKAFAWLAQASTAAMQKAALSRQMTGFSFDSVEVPQASSLAGVPGATMSPSFVPLVPASAPQKREGRLLRVDPNEPSAPVESGRPARPPNDDDDVDWIDE